MQAGPIPSVLGGSAKRRGSALAMVFAIAQSRCETITISVGKGQRDETNTRFKTNLTFQIPLGELIPIGTNHGLPNLFLHCPEYHAVLATTLVQTRASEVRLLPDARCRFDQWQQQQFSVGYVVPSVAGGLG